MTKEIERLEKLKAYPADILINSFTIKEIHLQSSHQTSYIFDFPSFQNCIIVKRTRYRVVYDILETCRTSRKFVND